jgi:hypothetical protein
MISAGYQRHPLVMRALEKYTECRWVLLHLEPWLQAPLHTEEDGIVGVREKGSPHGDVINRLLSSIFCIQGVLDQAPNASYVPPTVLVQNTCLHCLLRRDFILGNLSPQQPESPFTRVPQGLRLLFRGDAALGRSPRATGWRRPERPLPRPQKRSRQGRRIRASIPQGC